MNIKAKTPQSNCKNRIKLLNTFESAPLSQSITVTFNYTVHATFDLFDPANSLLSQVLSSDGNLGNCLIVIDGGLIQHYPELCDRIQTYVQTYTEQIQLKAPPLIISGGERAKQSDQAVTEIQQLIHQAGLCRHSYVVAIGGGAILDTVGYAAATAHRGIRLIRVPTTVLAQADSGVGVKNGINAFGQKNFLGTFAPPYAVINDAAFLTALPQREWIGGIAEAVKVALIKDARFFDWIEQRVDDLVDRDLATMQQLIHRCAQLHLEHIGTYGDPFEMGTSRPLDFGHWSAHRLEHLTNYRLRHGEAVAIGMAIDCCYAKLEGRLTPSDCQRVLQLLAGLGFTLWVPELSAYADEPEHPASIFRGLQEFREHLGGELTLMLLSQIGQGIEVHQVDLKLYQQAIEQLYLLSIAVVI